MPGRRGRVAWVAAVLVALLFLGRWTTVLLSEYWWARSISEAAAAFLARWHLIRILLDLAGIAVASAWFVGNLLVVYRAIGSVQVPRQLANLEIREALTPRVLVTITVVIGVLLGIAAGSGLGALTRAVMLAWHGVHYGLSDPLLELDLGLYVGQLPLWRQLHSFSLLLALLGFGTVILSYVLVGSVRWVSGRPAVSDHARRHLGWLLALLALLIVWGYRLEPYEMVAGLDGIFRSGQAQLRIVVAQVLTGAGLAAALLSAWWAIRPRHALLVAGWAVLVLASITGHHILPLLLQNPGAAMLAPRQRVQLEELAFGLGGMEDTTLGSGGLPGPPEHPALWDLSSVGQLGAGDSSEVVSANPASLTLQGRRRPAWLVLRSLPNGRSRLLAVADDRVTANGGPLTYRPADSLAYPGVRAFVDLPLAAVRPGGPEHALVQEGSRGVPVGGWGRRLVLAWARQAGALLGAVPRGDRLVWHLNPQERLQRVAPFVEWGAPRALVVEGAPVWYSEGLVVSATFPLIERVEWQDQSLGAVRAGFLGTIDALTGQTHIYLRPGPDPLSRAWAEAAGPVVEPASAIPGALADVLPYPLELFQLQARVLQRPQWVDARLAGRGDGDREARVQENSWLPDGSGPRWILGFQNEDQRHLVALVSASEEDGFGRLTLRRLTVSSALPDPGKLVERWRRFATWEQLSDSLRAAGVTEQVGPVRWWVSPAGAGAYQAIFGRGPARQIALAWVNVAEGERQGAGRTTLEAWRNLQGESAPIVPTLPTGRLAEAEQWMRLVDSAMQQGDWALFGRALESLRQVLLPGAAPDSGVRLPPH